MATATLAEQPLRGAMVPAPFRVAERTRDTADTWTLALEPLGGEAPLVGPGQFVMATAFGIGEVPISVSGAPLVLTVRAVGAVTRAVCAAEPGHVLGIRGPFGNEWPVVGAAGGDVVVVAGGIGLAPLRPVVRRIVERRGDFGSAVLCYGARTPGDLLYTAQLEEWRRVLDVGVTVDTAGPEWPGHVGVVTKLLAGARFDPDETTAFVCGPEIMMRFAAEARRRLDGAPHGLRHRPLRPLPARPDAHLPRRPDLHLGRGRPPDRGARAVSVKPKLAVWKFASCDGCQLSLLDLEDELLALAGAVEVAEFREATSGVVEGPYDLSLVEGSITTAHDAERIQEVRRMSRALVTIGACATAGGIQALRNFADVRDFVSAVYASPEYVSTLATSTPIAAHVPVDFELRGCPIDKRQLLEVVTSFLHGRKPAIPETSVCTECKRRGLVCVAVAHGVPCLGPVTHAGCGALCPSFNRGCFGCFGPMETPNTDALVPRLRELGLSERGVERIFRTFAAGTFDRG
jgi:coenzyme F420-reducing hydrogenase gamma subunit/NAD(P)H-flavin reductase